MNLHEIIIALCVIIIFFMIFVNSREDDVEEIYDIPPKDHIVTPLAWLVERVEYNNGVIEYRIYNKGRVWRIKSYSKNMRTILIELYQDVRVIWKLYLHW